MSAATSPSFVHLHLHTEYSLLDGACRIKELIAACKDMNMPACAISDHGNLFGAIDFYSQASAAGVKPIIGCELYLAPADRRDRQARRRDESAYHLLLLAQNLQGYRNLIKLASIGYVEGFYRKPRIDKEVLREFSDGLICTSTCLGGEIPQELINDDYAAAKAMAETYLDIFGPDRFFMELQDHGIPEQRDINPELADLSQKLGVGLIATNDVHYLRADDVEAHDVLCCISTRARVADDERFKFPSGEFYLKSPEQMAAALPDYPQSLANTLHVAEMCNVEFDFSKRYAPKYEPPPGKTDADYLRELVYAGAAERYPEITEELRERIDYELSVIQSKGFSSYFLIVWDFVNFARDQGIPVNTRGSGCSSVVGYCLKISAVDPLRYGLFFERFMDPDRDEMPDIDVDMCQDRRQEVIEYVRHKYGHVAQIITFGRLKARAAIRDICRTLDVPLDQADRIAKLVPEELKMTIDKALDREPELRNLVENDATVAKVIDIGRKLEGLARHSSIHAAGVVIADVPLDTLVPLAKPPDATEVTTQFEGPTVEKVGLLKMDFLGLRTLSQMQRCVELVEQNHGVRVDLEALALDDQRVYATLARGDTRGIFQFESGGMRDVLQKMKPNRIEDLIAANALYRPGPMAYIDSYVARKHGRETWSTPHSVMTEVLEETYGVLVYQEQVSRLVNRLGGVPLKRSFRLAKAISKKKTAMIDAERGPFIEGCAQNGVSRTIAEQIFSDILKFGEYAFNKAHSTGYAVVAYQTAFLKTYYPVEFMAAVLSYEMSNTDKIAEYLDECRRIKQTDGSVGIDVNPPDVNESDHDFTVVYPAGTATDQPRRGSIRFGLAAISGVGRGAVDAIKQAREEGGRFRDIFDFCERVDLGRVNRAVLETLIKAGAFDSTGAMRKALMDVVDAAIETGASAQRDRKAGQLSIFGDVDDDKPAPTIGTEEWTDAEMLAHEKAVLGFFVTRHPLTSYETLIRRFSTVSTASLGQMSDGQRVLLGGLISRVRTVMIRNGRNAGKKMQVLTFEDFSGSVEATVFSEQFTALADVLRPDSVVFLDGTVSCQRNDPSIRVADVIPVTDARRRLTRNLVLRLRSTGQALTGLGAVREICAANRGPCEVYFQVTSCEGWQTTIRPRDGLSVDPHDGLLEQLAAVDALDGIVCGGPRGAVLVN